jgi:hypothetical protein
MVNTLKEGADKLTLADTNEEGANMLALQTRQQLGVTSLSLASQAAQSVLRHCLAKETLTADHGLQAVEDTPCAFPAARGGREAHAGEKKRFFPSSFFFEGR